MLIPEDHDLSTLAGSGPDRYADPPPFLREDNDGPTRRADGQESHVQHGRIQRRPEREQACFGQGQGFGQTSEHVLASASTPES
ncbi:MAG: hypothetical protein CL933_19850 [Deltaproteobacteria bacterium]|nr:hypothetical protein [Deltaproteobacteria bacterium]